MMGGILFHRMKMDRCKSRYAASRIKTAGFRNFRAVHARYRFVEKGKTLKYSFQGDLAHSLI